MSRNCERNFQLSFFLSWELKPASTEPSNLATFVIVYLDSRVWRKSGINILLGCLPGSKPPTM